MFYKMKVVQLGRRHPLDLPQGAQLAVSAKMLAMWNHILFARNLA